MTLSFFSSDSESCKECYFWLPLLLYYPPPSPPICLKRSMPKPTPHKEIINKMGPHLGLFSGMGWGLISNPIKVPGFASGL